MPDVPISDTLTLGETLTVEVVRYQPMFGSCEGADRYFSEQLYGQPWSLLSLDMKKKGLMTATRSINTLRFAGKKTSETQPLEYPRNGDTEVPDGIQKATYEEALSLVQGVDPSTELDSIFVSSRVFGKVRTDYDFRTAPEHRVAGIASSRAWNLLIPFLHPARTLRLRRES